MVVPRVLCVLYVGSKNSVFIYSQYWVSQPLAGVVYTRDTTRNRKQRYVRQYLLLAGKLTGNALIRKLVRFFGTPLFIILRSMCGHCWSSESGTTAVVVRCTTDDGGRCRRQRDDDRRPERQRERGVQATVAEVMLWSRRGRSGVETQSRRKWTRVNTLHSVRGRIQKPFHLFVYRQVPVLPI